MKVIKTTWVDIHGGTPREICEVMRESRVPDTARPIALDTEYYDIRDETGVIATVGTARIKFEWEAEE